jgi:hypothetical protein
MRPISGFVERRAKNGKKVGYKCSRCAAGIAGQLPKFVVPTHRKRREKSGIKPKFNLDDWNRGSNERGVNTK